MAWSSRIIQLILCHSLLLLEAFAHPSTNAKGDRTNVRNKRFESAEHKSIGDLTTLQYPNFDVPGTQFGYNVRNEYYLSYGDIVALAGDYYGNWQLSGCAEQISDNYDTDPNKSIAVFNMISTWLQEDRGAYWPITSRYLGCVLGYMQAEFSEVETAIIQGQDPAQKYANISSRYDDDYFSCTTAYAQISLCNFDHFGPDAIKAYKTGHSVALSQAAQAFKNGRNTDLLTQAYFSEAFAQHYLTDLFAAGHNREPRRQLHWTVFADDPDDNVTYPQIYPADRCAQREHDEDNANGLWMQNLNGDSWASYGDKELFNEKAQTNFKQALRACQTGLNEVYSTFLTGVFPPPNKYSALNFIPILDNLNKGYTNFFPMFNYSDSDSTHLYIRTVVDDRNSPSYTSYNKPISVETWEDILGKATNSSATTYLHPYTKGFQSPNQILHIRYGQGTNLIVNTYGGTPGNSEPWNMLSQAIVPLPKIPATTNWISTTAVDTGNVSDAGVYLLVGRSGVSNATHVGLSTNGSPKILWAVSAKDGNDQWAEGETLFGQFAQGSGAYAMIKYFTNGPTSASKLELWSYAKGTASPPTLVPRIWNVGKINSMLNLFNTNGPSGTFLATGYDPLSKTSTFYFSLWSSDYSTQWANTLPANASFPVQALLTSPSLISSNTQIVTRLFYGSTYPVANQLRIDTLLVTSNGPAGSTIQTLSSQTFTITWTNVESSQYLSWTFEDVSGDGYPDLIAYISSKTNTAFQTVVFPSIPGSSNQIKGFNTPIISNISFPLSITNFWAGGFMTNAKTVGTGYRFEDGAVSGAGVLSFWDNLGVLGVRMAAPVSGKGGAEFELKGQTPGIAGQVSAGLGSNEGVVKVMGTGAPLEELGFVVVPSVISSYAMS